MGKRFRGLMKITIHLKPSYVNIFVCVFQNSLKAEQAASKQERNQTMT